MLPSTKQLELCFKYETDIEHSFLDGNWLAAGVFVKKFSVVFKTSYRQVAISLTPSELAKVIPKYFSSNLTQICLETSNLAVQKMLLVGKPRIILL